MRARLMFGHSGRRLPTHLSAATQAHADQCSVDAPGDPGPPGDTFRCSVIYTLVGVYVKGPISLDYR